VAETGSWCIHFDDILFYAYSKKISNLKLFFNTELHFSRHILLLPFGEKTAWEGTSILFILIAIQLAKAFAIFKI
jgi:hypothetical protein